MEIGSAATGLLTGLREGVEAALIVSIVVAYLVRTGNGEHAGRIWLGVGGAVTASAVLGLAIFATVRELQAPYEQLLEGVTMLAAAGVVTWMLFWMRRQSATVGGQLRAAVNRALTDGRLWGLTALAFVAVIREGIETALFLVGQANAATIGGESGAPSVLFGAIVGLGIATALGYAFYRGSRRVNLSAFFRWTGVALVFIAAGLLSQAIHELIEIGVIRVGTQAAYDFSAVLPHEAPAVGTAGPLLAVGQLLRALLGYSANPEVLTLAVHLVYVVLVLALFLRPYGRPATVSQPATEIAGS